MQFELLSTYTNLYSNYILAIYSLFNNTDKPKTLLLIYIIIGFIFLLVSKSFLWVALTFSIHLVTSCQVLKWCTSKCKLRHEIYKIKLFIQVSDMLKYYKLNHVIRCTPNLIYYSICFKHPSSVHY